MPTSSITSSSRSTCTTRASGSRCRRRSRRSCRRATGRLPTIPQPFEFVGPAPAGSLSAPAEDMAHFMIAHLQDGEYHGQRILSAATAEMMHNSPLTILPRLDRMELGFFETNINGHEVIAHLGDTDWFHTSLHLFLKENTGLYMSFNSLGKEGAAGTLRNVAVPGLRRSLLPGRGAASGDRAGRRQDSGGARGADERPVAGLAARGQQLPEGARVHRPDQGRGQQERRAGAALPGSQRQAPTLGRDRALRVAGCRGT